MLLLAALVAASLGAQTHFTAYDAPAGTMGNQSDRGLTAGNDFYVLVPVTIWQLGVFDDQSDGIQGDIVLTAQLFARNGNEGTLLESLVFDTTSPGEIAGSFRYKTLAMPVTLQPGAYTIAASGFDKDNRAGNAGNHPYARQPIPWTTNGGGGLLRFEGGGRFGYAGSGAFPNYPDHGPEHRYATASFTYSAAPMRAGPWAADYSALTAGVTSYPADCCVGSLAVFGRSAFPVLAEPGGRRLVLAAAGRYEGRMQGGRAVVFAHTQFVHATNDARVTLLDNAIRWAARKANSREVLIGLGPELDAELFTARGWQVKSLSTNLAAAATDLSGCDVLVADWHAGFTAEAFARIATFNANGGGMVMAVTPWAISYQIERPEYVAANQLLHPFGLALRDSQTSPADDGFTNVAAQPWPAHCSAFNAADLLRQERQGRICLSGFDKLVALGAINYTLSARPDLLCELTATCTGQMTLPGGAAADAFVDLFSLNGANAATNQLGEWTQEGSALVARSRRGAVGYDFNVPAGDVYRIRIEGGRAESGNARNEFPLIVSVDGVPLGRHLIVGESGAIEFLTSWLVAGSHTLRVFWDNAASGTALRIDRVVLQAGLGGDANGDGIKDWVAQRLRTQSGFDLPNGVLASTTSPVCVEGRDPFLTGLRLWLSGPGDEPRSLSARPAPNGRWFTDVPLPRDPSKRVSLEARFQHGAFTETRQYQWQPLNLLTADDQVVRQGDSLLFTVGQGPKERDEMVITVGTNQLPDLNGMPVPHAFHILGQQTVTGVWQPRRGGRQSRSITVKVVGHKFSEAPACWVGKFREWNLANVPPEAVIEADDRLLCSPSAALPDNGRRYSLLTDESEPRTILSRLGAGGPVLDAATARGFRLWAGQGTYIEIAERHSDGSRVVETLLVASPPPPEVAFQLSIFVGGITFDDGTTYRELTLRDFDARGQCRVRFNYPADAHTSVCHTLTAVQGETVVGSR